MNNILLTENNEVLPIPGFKYHIDDIGDGKFLISEKKLIKGVGFVISHPIRIVKGEVYKLQMS